MKLWAWAALLPLAWIGSGCGSSRGGGVELEPPSAAIEGASGRRCSYVGDADQLPPLDQLVRIGTRGNLALWGRGTDRADSVELSLRYDDQGRLAWVQTLDATMAADRVSEAERLVRSAVSDQGPEDWGVRLLLVGGAVRSVLPSVLCRPRQTAWAHNVFTPIGSGREMAELYASLGRAVRVQVSLDDQGRVMDVRLPYSSGSRLLDQYIIDQVRAGRYEPKLHDGIGVASVMTFTLRYRRGI